MPSIAEPATRNTPSPVDSLHGWESGEACDCCQRGRKRLRRDQTSKSTVHHKKRRLERDNDRAHTGDAMDQEVPAKKLQMAPPSSAALEDGFVRFPHANARDSSANQSRSRSPARRTKSSLYSATPRVSIAEDLDLPVQAQELAQKLQAAAKASNVPAAWDTAAEVGNDMHQDPANVRALHVLNEARVRKAYGMDESSWIDVVRLVMAQTQHPTVENPPSDVGWHLISTYVQQLNGPNVLLPLTDSVCSQSQSIGVEWLPKLQNGTAVNRKSDLAIAYGPKSAELAQIYGRAPLSHMADAFTSTVPVALPIEVKRAGGDMEEAEVQLAVALGSALQFQASQQNARLPHLGLTVVGHDWRVYIASWLDSHQINIWNVGRACNGMGTHDPDSLAKLLDVLRECVDWVVDSMWPAQKRACLSIKS